LKARPSPVSWLVLSESLTSFYIGQSVALIVNFQSCFFVLSFRPNGAFREERALRRRGLWRSDCGVIACACLPFYANDYRCGSVSHASPPPPPPPSIRGPRSGMESGGRFCRTALSGPTPHSLVWARRTCIFTCARVPMWIHCSGSAGATLFAAAIGAHCPCACADLTLTRHHRLFPRVLAAEPRPILISPEARLGSTPYAVLLRPGPFTSRVLFFDYFAAVPLR